VVDTRIYKHFEGSDHVPIELEIDIARAGDAFTSEKVKKDSIKERSKSLD